MTDQQQLSVGDKAPDFTLPDSTGTPVSLSDYRGGPVIVYFYPRAATPGCTTQACDFRDNLSLLNAAGYQVLGISPDPQDKLASFAEAEGLTFPLLSDPDTEVMTLWGAYGEKTSYGKVTRGVIRSTVVVDSDGTVAVARYNVKATGHVVRLLTELDIHG
ncbi:thioredoxin-dependent thiol peroxidase [Haloechinothrix sp. LS1_15]|uniref:thioredoxin-dependent thiol peroxidase n=1 Tax=Haloechinothrix sp. LS1_15 TaxID=2652248 RepID=UPI0029479D29|nr:thioredoxin-dependent thiol peroxidase [Haloechinothrix sp. LS1_15]MDV6011823.1 thioredoxin-dependent thiol peroxidase [Haloechinothrix sp. LS1_15]